MNHTYFGFNAAAMFCYRQISSEYHKTHSLRLQIVDVECYAFTAKFIVPQVVLVLMLFSGFRPDEVVSL